MKDIFKKKKYFLYISSILFLYIAVRVVTWNNTVLLEGTDSLFYLENAEAYLSLDVDRINNLNSDSTPFYPFFSALFSSPGWSIEFGARLCSLIFSLLLFFSLLGIFSNITDKPSQLIGLVILSFSPSSIPLSISVFTEPSYIAVVYAGMWLFFAQYKDPEYWKSALLGIIFAAAFLNRTEGILFIVVIPFLQGLHYILDRNRRYNFKKYLVWCLIFFTLFSILAVPQIVHVSSKMGSLALNGRQAWHAVMNLEDGKSYVEKLYGLDHNDGELNIVYARKHYSEFLSDSHLSASGLTKKVKDIARNFNSFYQNILGEMIKPFGFIFLGFGIISLYASKKRLELSLILSFIAFNLVGPLNHSVVSPRHVFIILPMIYILEGIGICFMAKYLVAENRGLERFRHVLPVILATILVLAEFFTLRNVIFYPKTSNREYNPVKLEEPSRIVRDVSAKESINNPIVAADRGYLSYFSGAEQIYTPFTDYSGLVKYLRLNNVHFFYLKHRVHSDYPFINEFSSDSIKNDFKLLSSKLDSEGMPVELYRFNLSSTH